MSITNLHVRSNQLYKEEHDIAAPLIASILWGHSGEQKQAAHQLASINGQIRAKNISAKLYKASGCIDIFAFEEAAECLRQASTAFASNKDTTLFKEAKQNLQQCIRLGKLPASWNIEWEDFMDFHRDRLGRPGLQEPTGDAYQLPEWEHGDPSSSKVLTTTGADMSAGSQQFHREHDVLKHEKKPEDVYYNQEEPEDEYYDEEEPEDEYYEEEPEDEYYEEGPENEYYDEEEEEEGEDYDQEDEANDGSDEEDSSYNGSNSVKSRHEEPELTYDTTRGLDCVELSILRGRAQSQFGLLLSSGSILGWRETKDSGMVAIMGYECQGKRTARVKCLRNDEISVEESIAGREKYTSAEMQGIGLIAWAVDEISIFEPVRCLYPTPSSTYPTTFIAILWADNIWTWESREIFHSLVEDLSPFEVDVLLYFIAVYQESEYQKRLTGKRPVFPVPIVGAKASGISSNQAM